MLNNILEIIKIPKVQNKFSRVQKWNKVIYFFCKSGGNFLVWEDGCSYYKVTALQKILKIFQLKESFPWI